MENSKYSKMGQRRKVQTKEKIGWLILSLSDGQQKKYFNVEMIRKHIWVSFLSMHQNIDFLIWKENGKAYIELEEKYRPVIKETEKVLEKLLRLSPNERKIAELVFIKLWRNASK